MLRNIAFAVLLTGVLVLAGCETKVTLENYQQIKPKMTMTEVVGILGEGTEEVGAGGTSIDAYGLGRTSSASAESQDRIYVWKDGNNKIVITFNKGVVVGFSQEGLQ